jgi:muramoyltetrapeptide carboxypeptidase
MAGIRYPAPLRPGDVVGVTAPSSGVPVRLRGRLEFAVRHLERAGYEVLVGECIGPGDGITSAPADRRAAELTAMLIDPVVRAVVPPWGGELAVDLLPLLDLDAIGRAEPTWVVGYSDLSTLLLPLTLRTGVGTVHGSNLMDTPNDLPTGFASWLDLVTGAAGSTVEQTASSHVRTAPHDDWAAAPETVAEPLDAPSRWSVLGADRDVSFSGRLVGGCVETISSLRGTPFGDLGAFAATHAPEGLVVYLEVAEASALDVARQLHAMRLAGWFRHAVGIVTGRTTAPDSGAFTQHDAVAHALGDLGVPVVLDADIGHQPPQMPLVNGARALVSVEGGVGRLVQFLVP